MSNAAFDFRHLSVAERLQLVEDIWDSIAVETPDAFRSATPSAPSSTAASLSTAEILIRLYHGMTSAPVSRDDQSAANDAAFFLSA